MKNVPLAKQRKIICLGIGGESLYYVALFFLKLGTHIVGYDITKSEKTSVLEKNGAAIYYQNPEGKLEPCDLIFYSDSLPDYVINKIKSSNPSTPLQEVGEFVHFLVSQYTKGKLTNSQQHAFRESGIAPLYDIKLGNEKLIGVTGTDGKTTVVSMICHILSKTGTTPGVISTVGAQINNQFLDTGLHTTTPSQQQILPLLQTMQKNKCSHIVIECTSQGLFMGRLAGLHFDVAVFTNITNEHLGYHKTWKRYAQAKSLLITDHLKPDGNTVLNLDDKKSYTLLKKLATDSIDYSCNPTKNPKDAAIRVKDINESATGITFEYHSTHYSIPVLGKYNVSNVLAAACALQPLGIGITQSFTALADFPGVEGRMQVIQSSPFIVIIDFAHTPNGLFSALTASRRILQKNGRLVVVFGCAAKRDATKRISMGKYAKKFADITILTAEDSRSENLAAINDQIEEGWHSEVTQGPRQLIRFDDDKKNVKVRRDAIKKALEFATKGDVVLITGKGHEKSLCFGTTEYPWSDIDETKKLLVTHI